MTGMKEGAGEDPFAEGASESTDTADTERSRKQSNEEMQSDRPSDDRVERTQSSSRQMGIPYKFRRDGVQDGRDRVPLFLMDDTKTAEREALRELEDRFGDTVSLTDLREAVVKAGLEELDEVEQHLEEWGYGMSFDE